MGQSYERTAGRNPAATHGPGNCPQPSLRVKGSASTTRCAGDGIWARCAARIYSVEIQPYAYLNRPLPIGFDKTISQPLSSR